MQTRDRRLIQASGMIAIVCVALVAAGVGARFMPDLFGTAAASAPRVEGSVSPNLQPAQASPSPVVEPAWTAGPAVTDPVSPAPGKRQGGDPTLDSRSAQRRPDRAAAHAGSGRVPSEAAAPISDPAQATPERPWPPRHLPMQRIDQSLLTPSPRPRKPRPDDERRARGTSVQIQPGNPG